MTPCRWAEESKKKSFIFFLVFSTLEGENATFIQNIGITIGETQRFIFEDTESSFCH
jgi:hypothetical protein